jgi:hypothetical protein
MAQTRLSLEDKIRCIRRFSILNSAAQVVREWPTLFESPPPSRQTVTDVNRRFNETGSVADLPRSGRPRSSTGEENREKVEAKFTASPGTSIRKAAMQLGISRMGVQRILKEIGVRPFRPTLVQGLLEDDYDRRTEFCETWLEKLDENPELENLVLWSDESVFKMNGHVNRHNCVYWSSENPKIKIETEMNAPGVCCWAGIWTYGVIGPFFFDGNVSGQSYLAMLNEKMWPEVQQRTQVRRLWFQQDGAPAHYDRQVRQWLDEKFPGRWLGRRGPVEWPPRSCDLTPCDFFLWGVIKERVYATKPRDLEDLRTRITNALHALEPELCSKVCHAVRGRLEECLESGGAQVV